ncbi:MAG: Gfo/Idh/MocA family protein [Geminicoccaceae bacterium]
MVEHRVALIGLGMAVHPHAKSLVDLADRVEVTAAFSRTATRREAFAKTFPFPGCDDLDAISADESINAVMILTPPNTHLDMVRRFATAGKHILLEKPLERSTERAEALVNTVKAAGVRLGIVFQFRFRAASERLKSAIDRGELGDLATVSVVCPWWRPQSYYNEPGRGTHARDGGGVLMAQAIHTLDLMLSLAGPVSEVSGLAATSAVHQMETEDFVGAGLRFASGAAGGLIATTASFPGRSERIEIVGTEATATLEAGHLRLAFRDGRTETIGESHGSGGGADPMDFPHDSHRALLTDFLDALDQDRDPRATGEDGLRVQRLIDALLLSSSEKRSIMVTG